MTRAARRIGVFPGQFDPITNGHLDVIRRGVEEGRKTFANTLKDVLTR